MESLLVKSPQDIDLWLEEAEEINRLHNDILGSVVVCSEKAIRIGELLSRIREAQKKSESWISWVATNVRFSQRTAYNYIGCYDHRDEIRFLFATVANLTLKEIYRWVSRDDNGNTPGSGRQKLREFNFYSQAIGFRDHLISLFNHHLKRRPLRQWYTEEIYDFWRSLNGIIELKRQLELELNTREDVPSGYRS